MKILVIGPFPNPINGCSLANQTIFNNIKSLGLSCSFIDTNTSIVSSSQGSKFSLKKAFSFFPIYLQSLKITKASIVYMTPGQTFFGILKYSPFILVCILAQRPYIIHLHGNYLGKQYNLLTGIKKKIFYALISKASAGIVLSESLRANFINLLPATNIHVVKNFVNESLFSLSVEKRRDKMQILYLSNLMSQKGILELLSALEIIDDLGIDFSITIAGIIETKIEDEISKHFLSLKNKLSYQGIVNGIEKKNVFDLANVFVLPTYYEMEGQPIALLEALATGNIIVTTNHAGIPDVITRKNGFLVSPKSIDDLVTTLLDIQENLPIYIDQFSKSNIDYAKNNFTEAIFSKGIIDIMQTNTTN